MPTSTLDSLESVLTESVAAVAQREVTALDRLPGAHHRRCVLYGAGTLGRQAANLLREIGLEPLAFVDSNPQRWGSDVSGLPVLSPSDAADRYGSSGCIDDSRPRKDLNWSRLQGSCDAW